MKKRPIGVILSAIVLGLIAAFQLLVAGLFVVMGIMFPSMANKTQMAGAPDVGLMSGLMIAMSIFVAILAAWGITTLVGLVRLKNWARWSILVIAGCLLLFSLFAIFGIAISSYFLPVPMQQNAGAQPVPEGLFHAILVFYALLYVMLGVLAGWWLVYFSLRSTRGYFLPGYDTSSRAYGVDVDFPPPLPFPADGAATAKQKIPAPVIIVAALFLLTALSCLPGLFLPFPLFFAGFVIGKPASIILYGLFILVFALLGIGLLRLDNRARLATFGLIGLGVVNMIVFLTPWCQQRFQTYYDELLSGMGVPGGLRIPVTSPPLMAISMLFGVGVYGFVAWTLREYRGAFKPTNPEGQDVGSAAL
jgi:hypothetical protein